MKAQGSNAKIKAYLDKLAIKLPKLVNIPLNVGLHSLFQEEICGCEAVHRYYVMDAYDFVWSMIPLPYMVGTSFVLGALIRLNVGEPEHWVIWSHKTGVNFPFLRGKRINT